VRLRIRLRRTQSGLRPFLFCIDDFVFVSYIFYFKVIRVIKEFSPSELFGIIGRVVKIYLLRILKQIRRFLIQGLLCNFLWYWCNKLFWLSSDTCCLAFNAWFKRAWVNLAVICHSNIGRDDLSKTVRAFFSQRNFTPMTRLVYPLNHHRLGSLC